MAFDAFIAYADLPAARRALHTIDEVLRAAPRPHSLHPMLWRFDQIAAAKWHASALADATKASIVVLASSSGGLTPELESWIGEILAHKRGARITIVALLGGEEAWTVSIEETANAAGAATSWPTAEQRLVA